MPPVIHLSKLSTSDDLVEALRGFGESDSMERKCYYPVPNASDREPAPERAEAVGAVITINNLFGDAQDVVVSLVDLEMKLTLHWAERCFKGSALSLVSFYHVPPSPENANGVDLPFCELSSDILAVCDEPTLQLLMVPLRRRRSRQKGVARPTVFEEHVDAMA